MPDWGDLLEDSRGLRAIFGERAPDLHGVVVHEISLATNGPQLVARFDLHEFPDPAPGKWERQGFNTVQLDLSFLGVHDVNISEWGTQATADLNIRRDADDMIVMELDGSGVHVSARADFVLVLKINAYENARI